MKSTFFYLGLCILILSGCKKASTEYILSFNNQSTSNLNVFVMIDGNQIGTEILAGEERVIYSERLEGELDEGYNCLSNIDSLFLISSDSRQPVYNISNGNNWGYIFEENTTGYLHKCKLDLADNHLY